MATLDRLGFCQRCGDPVSGKVRCSKCGGSSAEPKVRTSAPPSTSPRNDPWASRYVSGSFTSDDLNLTTSNSSAILSPRASTDPGLGLGMPSRISKDLRSVQPPERGRTSERLLQTLTASSSQVLRTPSQDYSAPVVQSSDGVLSKVCGSLVEPSSSRNKWACHGCNSVFARDTTIYAPPSSAKSEEDVFFCKSCYSTRYGLGKCQACHKEVLGSTKEDGKFVKASAGLWHGRCWKCFHCEKGSKDGIEVMVGMDGRPCCESCFDKPKQARRMSVDIRPASTRASDVRSELRGINRPGTGLKGPMGAAISELSKKFGKDCSTGRSPNLASSSGNRSPTRGPFAFSDHLSRSPSRSGITRSGSITGSPPKPRPLTAQFTGDLNLAAFKTSVMDSERSHLSRSDSRSRSYSPSKRTSGLGIDSPSVFQEARPSKVPGSPNPQPSVHLPSSASLDPSRERTSSGFPRPLNTPFSKTKEQKEPIQGDKNEADSSGKLDPPTNVICSVCNKAPFEESSGQEVVMITLSGGVHMHVDCFSCVVCRGKIDASRTFTRLDDDYAHPSCAPTITVRVVREVDNLQPPGGERVLTQHLDAERNHVTHQRELRPSPTPSPASTVREAAAYSRATHPSFPSDTNVAGPVRRFQPSAGAAPPTRSTILAPRAAPNPAAGIFARTTQPSTSKFGGMQACAYCGEKISALESVIGPRSTQWHRNCLVCRGQPKAAPSPAVIRSRYAQPATCGKKLDSGAKVNAEGEVRCRDCFDRESSVFKVKA